MVVPENVSLFNSQPVDRHLTNFYSTEVKKQIFSFLLEIESGNAVSAIKVTARQSQTYCVRDVFYLLLSPLRSIALHIHVLIIGGVLVDHICLNHI